MCEKAREMVLTIGVSVDGNVSLSVYVRVYSVEL